jgi:hypothetical protein
MINLMVQSSALNGPAVVPSATFDSSVTEFEICGRECFTQFCNNPTPILNCFCLSGEINGSPSLGWMKSFFGADGVIYILHEARKIFLELSFRLFNKFG